MPKKPHGLGRGLDVLLPETLDSGENLREIPIGDIDTNPDQPRQTFPEETITQLAQSIRDQGVLQPLLVTPTPGGRYRIVAGERRWRAARQAGLTQVPCVVRELELSRQMEIALIENLQREDLNPMETAMGIRALMDECGYTQEAAAQRVAKSRPAVANLLRLLTLPDEIAEMIREGVLSAGHGRVLAGLETDEERLQLARLSAQEGWSVRQLEAEAARRRESVAERKPKPQPKPRPVELTDLENRIRETMGVRAAVKGSVKKGRIVLQYYSRDELERFNEILMRMEALAAEGN